MELIYERGVKWSPLLKALLYRSWKYVSGSFRCVTSTVVRASVLNTGTDDIRVHAQIQKPGRYCPKELKSEILTEDLRQRGEKHNRNARKLRRMGRDGRKRARELWETDIRAWVGDLVEGAEKKGLAGLHFLEVQVEKWTSEEGERRTAHKTNNLIREELEKAYSRAFQPLML